MCDRRVYILGGFLGSGKTSLLMKLSELFSMRKEKVTIIVNESGEVGVDGTTLRTQGYDAVELASGCICCSIAGTLQTVMKSIVEDIDPDVIMVEPTGLALPHKVRDIVGRSLADEDCRITIIGICDILRFRDLVRKKEEFFTKQLQGSEFILLNKSDVAEPGSIEEATAWLNARFPEKPVIPVSVKTGDNLERTYELIK